MLTLTFSTSATAFSYGAYAAELTDASEQYFNKKIYSPFAQYFMTMQAALDEVAPHQETIRLFFEASRRERHRFQKALTMYCVQQNHHTAVQLRDDFAEFKDAVARLLDNHFSSDEFVHFHQWVNDSIACLEQLSLFAYQIAVQLPHERQSQLSGLRIETLFIGFKFIDAFEGALNLPEEDWLDFVTALRDFVVQDQEQYWRNNKSLEEIKDGLERTVFCIYSFVNSFEQHYQGDLSDDVSSIYNKIA